MMYYVEKKAVYSIFFSIVLKQPVFDSDNCMTIASAIFSIMGMATVSLMWLRLRLNQLNALPSYSS